MDIYAIFSNGLRDVTGGVPQEFDLSDPASETYRLFSSGEAWSRIQDLHSDNPVLVGAAISIEGAEAETEYGQGLLVNHAYSVLRVSNAVEGKTMLEMRNPWGNGEWTGDYSDGWDGWTDELRDALGVYEDEGTSTGAEMTTGAKDDGKFWMCAEDFIKNFNHVYMCTVPMGWFTRQRHGSWTLEAKNCGGRPKLNTWYTNPSMQIEVVQTTQLFVVLTQDDARYNIGEDFNEYTVDIGACLYKASKSGKRKKKIGQADIIERTGFKTDREVSMWIKALPPGRYFIVCATFDSGVEGRFTLDVHSDHELATVTDPVEISKIGVIGEREGKDTIVDIKLTKKRFALGKEALERRFTTAMLDVQSLRSEVESLKAANAKLKSEGAGGGGGGADPSDLKELEEELEKQRNEHAEEIETLKRQLKKMQAMAGGGDAAEEHHREELGAMEKKLQEQAEDLAELKANAKGSENEKKLKDKHRAEMREAEAEITRLQGSLEAATAGGPGAESKLVRKELAATKAKLETFKARTESMKEDLEAAQRAKKIAEDEVHEVHTAIANGGSEEQTMAQYQNSMEKKLQRLEDQFAKAETSLRDCQGDLEKSRLETHEAQEKRVAESKVSGTTQHKYAADLRDREEYWQNKLAEEKEKWTKKLDKVTKVAAEEKEGMVREKISNELKLEETIEKEAKKTKKAIKSLQQAATAESEALEQEMDKVHEEKRHLHQIEQARADRAIEEMMVTVDSAMREVDYHKALMAHNTDQLVEIAGKANQMSDDIVARHPRMKALLPKIPKKADYEAGDAKWVEMQRQAADVVKSKQARFNTATDSLAQQSGWVKGMDMEKEVRDKVFALLAMIEMERALEMETFDSLDTMIHQYRRMVYLGKKEDDRPGLHHTPTHSSAAKQHHGENSKRNARHTRPSAAAEARSPSGGGARRGSPGRSRSPAKAKRSPSPSPKPPLPLTPPSPNETGETDHVKRLRRAREAKQLEASRTYKAGEPSPVSRGDPDYRDDYGQEYWSSYVDSIANRSLPASHSDGSLAMRDSGRDRGAEERSPSMPRPRSHDWIADHFEEQSTLYASHQHTNGPRSATSSRRLRTASGGSTAAAYDTYDAPSSFASAELRGAGGEEEVVATQCSTCGNIYLSDSNFCRKCGDERPGMSPKHSPSHFGVPRRHAFNKDRTVDGDFLIPEL